MSMDVRLKGGPHVLLGHPVNGSVPPFYTFCKKRVSDDRYHVRVSPFIRTAAAI